MEEERERFMWMKRWAETVELEKKREEKAERKMLGHNYKQNAKKLAWRIKALTLSLPLSLSLGVLPEVFLLEELR